MSTAPVPVPDPSLTPVVGLNQLRAGVVVHVGPSANVQFNPPIRFRVIRLMEEWTRLTYEGWCWLSGYVLDHYGGAVEQRHIFVQIRGLYEIREPPQPPIPPQRRKRTPE